MRDPLGVWTSGQLKVACQIVHVEHLQKGTLVDIVTLERCIRGPRELPAGTPFALGFGSSPNDDTRASLASIMTLWESTCAILALDVSNVPCGLRYHFASGGNSLTLLVEDRPDERRAA